MATPSRANAVDRSFADPDRPVVCSNLANVGAVVNRLGGTDAENTKPVLRELAARVLAEFDLTGQID